MTGAKMDKFAISKFTPSDHLVVVALTSVIALKWEEQFLGGKIIKSVPYAFDK
jgi:hypothetical protein